MSLVPSVVLSTLAPLRALALWLAWPSKPCLSAPTPRSSSPDTLKVPNRFTALSRTFRTDKLLWVSYRNSFRVWIVADNHHRSLLPSVTRSRECLSETSTLAAPRSTATSATVFALVPSSSLLLTCLTPLRMPLLPLSSLRVSLGTSKCWR